MWCWGKTGSYINKIIVGYPFNAVYKGKVYAVKDLKVITIVLKLIEEK